MIVVIMSFCKVIQLNVFVWIGIAILQTTDGASVTWYEPPPVQTTSNNLLELTADSQQLVEGSTHVQLSWNFSLTADLNLILATLSLNTVDIANIASGQAAIIEGFEGRFNVTWISNRATLIIFNVTADDNGEFGCRLNTFTKIWKRKVPVEVVAETSLTSDGLTGNRTVSEGSSLALFCNATGKPEPNITWTRVWRNGTDSDVLHVGSPWVIVNITRTYTGTYRCTAYNGIGNPVSRTLDVNVQYKPDMVTLVTNTTENKDCSDLWVNFTCISSEANPPVYNYLLSGGEDGFTLSKSGTWIKKTSRGGKVVYSCLAYQLVGNVTSTYNVTLSVNVPVSLKQAGNQTVKEGDNVQVNCNVTGIPDPNVIWTKVQGGETTEGRLLNITNITRDQAGEYRCTANNTCGEESTVVNIDVQYQPKNVHLTANTTSKVCTGNIINFKCTAEANPPVHTYLLYENDTVIERMRISGTWFKTVENAGQFVFRCEANNSVQGIGKSSDTVLTVNVPASVAQAENKLVEEGGNVEVYCNVTAGIPDPTVLWRNVKTGERIEENPFSISNVTRDQAGDYRCTANNTCGEVSTVVNIDVQYKPDMVTLVTNTTENRDCSDLWVNFTCISSEASPPVYNYLLSGGEDGFSFSNSGTWIKKISTGGKFVYNCLANQTLGNVTSTNNVTLTVNVPLSMKQAENRTVVEGDNVEVFCNVTGIPDPTVIWTKVQSGNTTEGRLLTITNITRDEAGEYRCTANNTCGEESTVVNIDVQYPAEITHVSDNLIVNENDVVILNCTADGEPKPSITWTRVSGNSPVSFTFTDGEPKPSTTWTTVSGNSPVSFTFTVTGKQDEGLYKCTADNGIGNAALSEVFITVQDYHPININLTTDLSGNSVLVNTTFNITCSAQASPPAKYRFYKDQDNFKNDTTGNNVSVITTSVRERVKQVNYGCTPFNDFGDGQTELKTLTVLYPASFTNPGNETFNVKPGEEVTFFCLGDGNPTPTTNWTSADRVIDRISKGYPNNVTFSAKADSSGLYLCITKNYLGQDFKWFRLVIEAKKFPIMVTITNKGCDDKPQEISEQLRAKVLDKLKSQVMLEAIEVKNYKCGSVTVYFSLEFTQSVAIPDVLSILKDAAEQKAFGDLEINPGSIQAISDDQVPTEPSTQGPPNTVGKSSESPCSDSFIQEANCDLKIAFIVIIVVVGVIVISLAICIVTWWVHKRRKCRKRNEVGNTPSEEQPFSRQNSTPGDDNPYSQVNNGYADAGPRSTEMTEMNQNQGASSPAAVPDHAVVDNKGKKNDKKVAEQKPPVEAEYAQVDKSKKKKKKEEPDATYAKVDMSKKSKKKKPNPGEVLYADLGEFNQMPEMPKVSTSPQPLPPIKKPTPYVETQYADITQFLKGDATLPDRSNSQEAAASHQGAALPDSSNGQEPAAGTKEDVPAANTSEAGKANNETVL